MFPKQFAPFIIKQLAGSDEACDENCEVSHNAARHKHNMLIVNDDLSLNKMIENCRNKQKTCIFICLKKKVCKIFYLRAPRG